MTSVEQAQKFHTYDMLPPRSESIVGLIAWSKFSTNQKHHLDLSRDNYVISMEFLHLFLRHHFADKPEVASPNVGCFLRRFAKVQIANIAWLQLVLKIWGSKGWRSGESAKPPTTVARVWLPASTPYVDWVCCWFSPLLREVFLQIPIWSGTHEHV